MSPAYPAFSLLSFPHPPNPLPGGKGEIITLFRRGLRPRHPCTEPLAALTEPAVQVLSGWLARAALARPAPGERTISNAAVASATDSSISPGPPSPWLPALPPVNKQKPLVVQVPRPSQPRGCKGRSPLHKKTLILPLPAGKGGGGMGAVKQAKGRADRRQRRQASRWVPGAAPQPQQKKQSPEPRTNLPLNNYIREKFLGVWGLLSRSPQRIPDAFLTPP